MPSDLTVKDAEQLIAVARESIKSVFEKKQYVPSDQTQKRFSENQGAFVTLHLNGELKGCIGYVEPVLPLWNAISDVAIAAAFRDIRFSALTPEELDKATIEISVLTVPKQIKAENPDQYLEKIKIGRDGLIIRSDFKSGLLLPQVPGEWGWDIEEYLENLCYKAGLQKDAWKQDNTEIESFSALVFKELEPCGKVVEVNEL